MTSKSAPMTDLQQRLVDAIYGEGTSRDDTVDELVDALIGIASGALAALAAAPKPQGDDLEPVAYIVHDPMAGEPEVSFIKTIGLENEPLYPASALQSLKTERDEIDRLFKARDEQLTAEFSVSSSMAKLAGEASRRAEAAEAENATLKREIAGLREALAKVQAICLSEDDAEDTEYILGVASRALSQGGK